MIALPLALMYLRADIDNALQPIQPTRKKIPKVALIGIGLAVPFLTAYILYNFLSISQYPLIQANMILGTLVSYAIVREPSYHKDEKRPGVQRVMPVAALLLVFLICVVPVLADDCMSDPLNAQDCLRTGGYAEFIAGLFAALLGGLVNGPIVIQGITQGGGGDEGDDDQDQEDDDDEEKASLNLTYPAGFSPRVFTHGWIFGASATVGDKDASDQVQWSGSGSFSPAIGSRSHPSFSGPGPNQIILTLPTKKGQLKKSFMVEAVSPAGYAHVGSLAQCPADAHGCPACPHPVVGPIQTGSHTIFINGQPAARVGDTGVHAACCGPNTFTIATGDSTVLINGRPAAQIGQSITHHCGGTGTIIS